jgi:hypothetical protein
MDVIGIHSLFQEQAAMLAAFFAIDRNCETLGS